MLNDGYLYILSYIKFIHAINVRLMDYIDVTGRRKP